MKKEASKRFKLKLSVLITGQFLKYHKNDIERYKPRFLNTETWFFIYSLIV